MAIKTEMKELQLVPSGGNEFEVVKLQMKLAVVQNSSELCLEALVVKMQFKLVLSMKWSSSSVGYCWLA